jgi:hypothetical protein
LIRLRKSVRQSKPNFVSGNEVRSSSDGKQPLPEIWHDRRTAFRTESWLMKHNPERRSKQALVVIALSTVTIVVCFSLLILQ